MLFYHNFTAAQLKIDLTIKQYYQAYLYIFANIQVCKKNTKMIANNSKTFFRRKNLLLKKNAKNIEKINTKLNFRYNYTLLNINIHICEYLYKNARVVGFLSKLE